MWLSPTIPLPIVIWEKSFGRRRICGSQDWMFWNIWPAFWKSEIHACYNWKMVQLCKLNADFWKFMWRGVHCTVSIFCEQKSRLLSNEHLLILKIVVLMQLSKFKQINFVFPSRQRANPHIWSQTAPKSGSNEISETWQHQVFLRSNSGWRGYSTCHSRCCFKGKCAGCHCLFHETHLGLENFSCKRYFSGYAVLTWIWCWWVVTNLKSLIPISLPLKMMSI